MHDTCVSKLMAGREKDFAFIKELLDRGLADIETFVPRAILVADMPQSNALSPRLRSQSSSRKSRRQGIPDREKGLLLLTGGGDAVEPDGRARGGSVLEAVAEAFIGQKNGPGARVAPN